MQISYEYSVDCFHSLFEKQIQICAKLSSLLFKILSSQEKKIKARKHVGWQRSSTYVAGASSDTSLTD